MTKQVLLFIHRHYNYTKFLQRSRNFVKHLMEKNTVSLNASVNHLKFFLLYPLTELKRQQTPRKAVTLFEQFFTVNDRYDDLLLSQQSVVFCRYVELLMLSNCIFSLKNYSALTNSSTVSPQLIVKNPFWRLNVPGRCSELPRIPWGTLPVKPNPLLRLNVPDCHIELQIPFVESRRRFVSRKNYSFPELKEGDLEEEFVRGSGPGGQSVNQTANCVVLKHKPTGIVVKCHETRSLHINRQHARERLKERLDLHINGDQSFLTQQQEEESRQRKEQKKRNKLRLQLKKSFKKREDLD